MAWRVARSLDVLLGQINARYPNRSKVSDGSIGDAAHATRDSDHNPWVKRFGMGIVRARDFTHDPAHGFDAHAFANRLKNYAENVGHPALKAEAYIISNRRIWSWNRRAEGWRPYGGTNPHSQHVHVSVSLAALPGFDSIRKFRVFGPSADELRRRRLARAAVVAAREEVARLNLALTAAKARLAQAVQALRTEREN